MVRLRIYRANGKEAEVSPLIIVDNTHSDESVKSILANNLFNSVLERRGVSISTDAGRVILGPKLIKKAYFV